MWELEDGYMVRIQVIEMIMTACRGVYREFKYYRFKCLIQSKILVTVQVNFQTQQGANSMSRFP